MPFRALNSSIDGARLDRPRAPSAVTSLGRMTAAAVEDDSLPCYLATRDLRGSAVSSEERRAIKCVVRLDLPPCT
jgi:hypothetical protein